MPQETAPLPPDPTPTVKIRWDGPVTFDYWNSIDLDTLPPNKEPDEDAEDAQVDYNGVTIAGSRQFAPWTDEASPTRQGCSDLVSTQGDNRIEVAKGQLICMKTSEGRTALLKVNSFDEGTVAAYAVIWESSS
ncbi:hypothetical protein [Actinopolymorpha pittospori]